LTRQEIEADELWLRRCTRNSKIGKHYVQRAAFSKDFKQITDIIPFEYYHFCLENGRYGVWANGVLSESALKKDIIKNLNLI
jgi:hypothetical protein